MRLSCFQTVQTISSALCLSTMSSTFLVIGGTSGIGLALTQLLQQQGHTSISASRTGAIHYNATIDALDPSALPTSLDGLVYCPGSINLKPFHRLTAQELIDDYKINVVGAVKTIQSVLPALKNSAQASIVLFSSVAVKQGMSFHASVAASKGAVEGLTRSLAAELAPKIRVNCIAPSLTDTPLAAKLLGNDEKRKASAERHPLKQIGSAADIAQLAFFLLTEQSKWMSGQVLGLDGGLSSLRV